MCGIAGYICKDSEIDRKKFEEMVDIIDYRGPNDRGCYYDGSLALGHRRLSIIDISSAGHQPYIYKERYIIVYNGEIYNYKELRNDLKERGYAFTSETDTEVVVASYALFGNNCVNHFNGMWAFAIYDKVKRTVFCSRDRFGVKPFYYYYQNGIFLFASEIKQILLMQEEQAVVNEPRFMEYLVRGVSDHTEETMIENIMQLRGGYNLEFRLLDFGLNIYNYYDLKSIEQSSESIEEAITAFRNQFVDSVRLRLRADVPIGYCLSGGLDSSCIVCVADRIIRDEKMNVKQTSISSCFEEKQYDEQEYIDEVLKNTEVDGKKVFPQEGNLFRELDTLLWHMDEPFASTSMYAQWNVFKEAKKQNLKVMLDGQGADEQLAGYTGFYSVIFAEYLRKFQFRKFAMELKSYQELRVNSERYVNSYKIVLEAIISAYLPRCLQKFGKLHLFYLRKKLPFKSKDIKSVINKLDLYPANQSRKYILDNIYANLSMLLRYEDRNSMAHSIESRVPFLDTNLVETVFRMPIDYKIRNGITKYVLREGMTEYLPNKIKTRYSKLGFVTPEDQWLNKNEELFRKEMEEASKTLCSVLDQHQVMLWYDSIAGNIQRMDFIPWRIICAGHWVKLFNLKFK